jgi:HEAT repeat protein
MSSHDPMPAAAPAPGDGGRSDASVVTQFFLLPLAVVAGMVGVFLLFTLVTRHPATPRSYLETLQSGRFNQRWQAAFELSNLLREGKGIQGDPGLLPELVRLFRKSLSDPRDDPRVRRYLALALGNSASREAVAPLVEAARGEDGECRLYALWGLARLEAPEAEQVFRESLADRDPVVRSVAAYGLGTLPETDSREDLLKLLQDPVDEVRWNAALALGRKGEPAGKEILVSLLDRKYLDRYQSMQASEKSATMLNAMRALKHMQVKGLEERLRKIAESDPDLKVREAARQWLSTSPG